MKTLMIVLSILVVVLAIGLVASLVILHEALKKQQEATPTNKVVSGEKLLIAPDSYIDVTFDPPVLHLHLYNLGLTTTVVNKVEVEGSASYNVYYPLGPGGDIEITVRLAGRFNEGLYYKVVVYTELGGSYATMVKAYKPHPMESLQIYPDSYINATNATLYLHVKNTGGASAVIYKVEVVGVTSTSVDYTVRPSEETKLEIPVNGTLVPGTNYLVKVYTRSGNVYSCTLLAR